MPIGADLCSSSYGYDTDLSAMRINSLKYLSKQEGNCSGYGLKQIILACQTVQLFASTFQSRVGLCLHSELLKMNKERPYITEFDRLGLDILRE